MNDLIGCWVVGFYNGEPGTQLKRASHNVRCVR